MIQAEFSPDFSWMGETSILLNKITLKLYINYLKVNGLGVLDYAFELLWAFSL